MKYLIPIFEFVESYHFEDGGKIDGTYYYFFSDGNNQFRVEAQDFIFNSSNPFGDVEVTPIDVAPAVVVNIFSSDSTVYTADDDTVTADAE